MGLGKSISSFLFYNGELGSNCGIRANIYRMVQEACISCAIYLHGGIRSTGFI